MDRFEQIKSQYRRWPGDTDPNGNWGSDVAWLIDEVEALRYQLAERDEYYRMVINEACQAPDEKHCTCVPALRQEIERQKKLIEQARSMARLVVVHGGLGHEPAKKFLQDTGQLNAFRRIVIVDGDMTDGQIVMQDASGLTVKVINLRNGEVSDDLANRRG